MSLLVELTLRGSAVVGVVWLLEALGSRWLAARHRRWLWLVVPLAFLCPFGVPVPVPAPISTAVVAGIQPPATVPPAVLPMRLPPAPRWLEGLWVSGLVLGAGIMAVRTVRAGHRWRHRRYCTDPAVLDEVEDARAVVGVTMPVGVIVAPDISAPALLGWLRPRLLLPAAWFADASPAERRDVILHELAHLRAADLAWSWLMTLATLVHWFNPLAWMALRRWRLACEEAADETALRYRAADSAPYAETLLACARFAGGRAKPFGALAISESFRQLHHRIHMIQTHPRPVLPGFCAGLLVLLLAIGALVRPMQAEPTEESARLGAVAAMERWLRGIDEGNYAASWSEASPAFQKAVTREQWVAALDAARKPAGACQSRKLASAMRQDGVPQGDGSMLKGDFVIAQFHSAFANLAAATETVTFERAPDGTWRASGYFIRPGQ